MTSELAVRGRREHRVSALIVLVLAFNLILIAHPQASSADDSILFGATPEAIDGYRQDGVDEIESQLGRKLDLVRVFERWEDSFPSNFHNEMIDEDRLMVVSVRPKRANGTLIPWRDIADAQPGSQLHDEMVSWADRVRDVAVPVWFTFHHEPESSSNSAHGSADDFIAAWQAVVDVFRDRGATNVSFAWIMTHWSFEAPVSDARHVTKWYPGDDYVDLIGSDAYNWDKCRDSSTDYWRTLEDTIEPQRQFGLDHPTKGLFLGEVASTELPSVWGDAKANWINEATELFKKPGWEQFVALSFFDVTDPNYPDCKWPIDSSPEALDALKAMANDAFYNNGVAPPPPPPPPPGDDPPPADDPPPSDDPPPADDPPPPNPNPAPGEFYDVAPTHPFYGDIMWMSEQGITAGCNPPDNDEFCPDTIVSRGQMAAFLVRALGYHRTGGGDLFVDDDDSPFESDIDKLATAGVTLGCNPPTNDKFCPLTSVTRAQMAAFLHRALD